MLDQCRRGACEGGWRRRDGDDDARAAARQTQPLDKRLFDSRYDDVEILGKLVTRGDY